MFIRKVSFLGLISTILTGVALGGAIPNWPTPAAWSPPKAHGVTTLSDISNPLPFIAVTPCRVADTRGNGFVGQYGPPALVANTTRSFSITGVCGIPSGAAAVSFNFAALDIGGGGDLRVFPAGGAVPLVSTLNYNANTPNIANAAVVALSIDGAITVQADAVPIDLIIDVNGYYSSINPGSNRTFVISDSAVIAILGETSSTEAGATGVFGSASAGPGAALTFGVFGVESSPAYNSAGVAGVDFSGSATSSNYDPAGVRGASKSAYGVLGLSRSKAVAGAVHDGTGTQIAYGILGTTNGAVTYGVYSGGDFGGSGAKYFVEPHPTDASKVIRYVSLEGPESGTYFRGTARTIHGEATVEVPESFRMVTDQEGLTVQLTPVGALATLAVISQDLNQIVVRSSKDVTFHYLAQGVRRAFKDHQAISEGQEFIPRSAAERMPGYLTEEAKRRLIANGTYNSDGTVNMDTAERVGWTKIWTEREAQAMDAASATSHATMTGERK